MKICLFEWNAGGHHNFYARAFAEALAPVPRWLSPAPSRCWRTSATPGRDPLAGGRAAATRSQSPGSRQGQPGEAGTRAAARSSRRHKPDHAVVLFADPVLRWLAAEPPFPCKISVFIMFATAHFPRAYGLPLSPRERASALFKERNIRRWRRRGDAHEIFGLDRRR